MLHTKTRCDGPERLYNWKSCAAEACWSRQSWCMQTCCPRSHGLPANALPNVRCWLLKWHHCSGTKDDCIFQILLSLPLARAVSQHVVRGAVLTRTSRLLMSLMMCQYQR